jgi:hypothetical protein
VTQGRTIPKLASVDVFPGLDSGVYLNTAAEGLFMRSRHRALQRYAEDKQRGSLGRDEHAAVERRARELSAQVMAARGQDVAFLASTARGLDAAIKSIAWRSGDNIVLPDPEFPTAELADAPRDRLAEVEARCAIFDAIADEYRCRGRRPYCIYGSSNPLGVMGYVAAAAELQRQFDETGVAPEWVVATSLGATQAGLELGSRLIGTSWRVCGFAYQPVDGAGDTTVARLFNEAAHLLGLDLSVAARDLINRDEWSGPDYAAPSLQSREAMRLAATLEGLVLDPVYSAKGMAGLIATMRNGVFPRERPVVFVHTGGQVGLFAHDEVPRGYGD